MSGSLNKLAQHKQKADIILPNQPHHDDFIQAMTTVFRAFRWIGIAGGQRIVWKIWAIILLLFLIAIECEAIWKVIKALAGWAIDTAGQRSVTARFAGLMFYSASLISLVQCWRLSCLWKGLSQFWASVERSLSIKQVPTDKTIKKRIYIVAALVSICSTIEHIVSIISTAELDCTSLCLRKFTLKSHGFLLLEHEYRDWIAIPLLCVSVIATMLWNLQELMIMLLSMGLTSRYRRLNECVATVCAMNQNNTKWCKNSDTLKVFTWRKIREAYVKQSMLVRRVDSAIGGLVLATNFFNFYFICLQLFLGVTPKFNQVSVSIASCLIQCLVTPEIQPNYLKITYSMPFYLSNVQGMSETPLKQVYFLCSLVWLCLRGGYSVLAAADVNKSSKLALPYLYECPPEFYNIEIERLQEQLNKEYIALSGMGFFYLNRNILLQIFAAIITYVLVLIQYDDSSQKLSSHPL